MTQTYKKKKEVPKNQRICRYCMHVDKETGLETHKDFVYCRHLKKSEENRPIFHETHTCKKFGAAFKVENKIIADRIRGGARSAR